MVGWYLIRRIGIGRIGIGALSFLKEEMTWVILQVQSLLMSCSVVVVVVFAVAVVAVAVAVAVAAQMMMMSSCK